MKVMILGANGMLGHKLYETLMRTTDVMGTIKGNFSEIEKYGFYTESHILPKINVLDIATITAVIKQNKPDVLLNCVGIIKQLKETKDVMLNIQINSLLPHQLFQMCHSTGIRFIHISTDCVFSGNKGGYKEDDTSDAEDIYGKTKYLGEVNEDGALTIRTSIVGRELSSSNGLGEWLISNIGCEVRGFTNAIFTGFPTIHFANIINDIIINYPHLSGLYHVSSEPISKYKLLTMIYDQMNLNFNVLKYQDRYCDRSLDSSLFRNITYFKPLTWEQMIVEFTKDASQYKKWRE